MELTTIECPYCHKTIELTSAVLGHIEKQIREDLEIQIEETIKQEKNLEIAELRQQLEEQNKKLDEARDAELELRKERRKLENRIKEIDLEVARRIDRERKEIEKSVKDRLLEEYQLKEKEKDKQLEDLRAQIEDLKRKAEQSSQQLQGEVAEISIEEQLQSQFPFDEIEPVGKGISGADILQKVFTPNEQYCGTIIWESKNTKHWNAQWITKLKDDQIASKAEIAILVSAALPDEVSHFANVDGVWVTGFLYTIELAIVLRESLVQLHKTRVASMGKDDKMELMYDYLSGPEFRQRIIAMVESFIALKEDLDREKRSMQRLWSKREKQIERVLNNIAGMYGDMQGIIALPTIEPLALPVTSEQFGNEAL